MKYTEAKDQFVQSWGALGSSWGISRTMAQIHAILMISPISRTAEDIMEEIGISRGNVSMSLKSLIEWGIVFKEFKPNDRKEYFYSEKDIWTMTRQVAEERRRRELIPVLRMLDKVSKAKLSEKNIDHKEFKKMTTELSKMAKHSDKALSALINVEKNWFFSKFLKFF